jgi:TonB family protein
MTRAALIRRSLRMVSVAAVVCSAACGARTPPATPGPATGASPPFAEDTRVEGVAPVRVGGHVPSPRQTKRVEPIYPAAEKSARTLGMVFLEALIDSQGRVIDVRVVNNAPPGLAAAALTAVKQWEYEPTKVNGVAVPVTMTVYVNYRLTGR